MGGEGGGRSPLAYFPGSDPRRPPTAPRDAALDQALGPSPDGGPWRYKWGGACVDGDGVAWGIPSDCDRVLRMTDQGLQADEG